LKHTRKLTGLILGAATAALMSAAPAAAQDVTACLITKTDTNPFFVKMKEGAQAKAAELGVTLKTFAGKVDGDHDSQVAAIEACIADGAKGILIAASDTKAIVDQVKKAQAAGMVVIALDTPLDPADAADATFATDNFEAGKLIGAWARATLGDKAADARIGFLNLTPSQPTVDVLRNQGFMTGFGIDTADVNNVGSYSMRGCTEYTTSFPDPPMYICQTGRRLLSRRAMNPSSLNTSPERPGEM
jgi:fructose transport system substrate-binding protein